MPPRKSLFARLEMMNTVREIEIRRELVDARLSSVPLFPSVMQYEQEASIRRRNEDLLVASSRREHTMKKPEEERSTERKDEQQTYDTHSHTQDIEEQKETESDTLDLAQKTKMQQPLFRWMNFPLAAAFNTWRDRLREEQEEADKSRMAYEHSTRMLLSGSLYTWIGLMEEKREEKRKMQRILSRWMNLTLSAAFNTWRDLAFLKEPDPVLEDSESHENSEATAWATEPL